MIKIADFLNDIDKVLEKKAFIPNPDVMGDQVQQIVSGIQQAAQGLDPQAQQQLQQQLQQIQQMPPVDQMQSLIHLQTQVSQMPQGQPQQATPGSQPSTQGQPHQAAPGGPQALPQQPQQQAPAGMQAQAADDSGYFQDGSAAMQGQQDMSQMDPSMMQQDPSQVDQSQSNPDENGATDLSKAKVTVSVADLLDLVSGGKSTATKLKLQEMMMKAKHKTDILQDTHEQEKATKAQELQIKQQEQQSKLEQQQQEQQAAAAAQQGPMGQAGGVYGAPMQQ